jgi:hypothetical protein
VKKSNRKKITDREGESSSKDAAGELLYLLTAADAEQNLIRS